MQRLVASLVFLGFLGVGCGAGEDPEVLSSGDKEDSPTASAADRGAIEIGTGRRARFTEAGQKHTFRLKLAAGASIRLDAVPSRANEGALKTTMKVFGPLDDAGKFPRQALFSTDDGTFAIFGEVAAAGDYLVLVGTSTKKMTGSYDLFAACMNRACHPSPVTLVAKDTTAALRGFAEKVACTEMSCSGDVTTYEYDGGATAPSAAALMEGVIRDVTSEDAEWATLEPREDLATLGVDEKVELAGLVTAARAFAKSDEVEAFHVDGVVMFAVDDFGTDGWDEELYVLHFPETRKAVALHVKK